MTDQNTDHRRLMLLLRRQLALKKDELLRMAHDLVDAHFEKDIGPGNLLTSAQLKNLEGVAFSSLYEGEISKFINKKSEKDLNQNGKRPEKQTWIFNGLNEQLIKQVKAITGRQLGKTTDDPGYKDAVIESVKHKAGSAITEEILRAFFSEEREQEIQMELLREFISQFSALYALKAAELRQAKIADVPEEENE